MSEIEKLLKEKNKEIEQVHYKRAAALCNTIGSKYLDQEKYAEALQEHLEELKYCEWVEDQLGIAVANRRIGECYTFLYHFEEALHHISQFYEVAVSLKSVIEEQRAWATFGRTYYLKYQHECSLNQGTSQSKDLDQAENAYSEALKLLPTLDSKIKGIELAQMRCRLLLNLGLVCEVRGDKSQSLEYFEEGFNIAVENSLQEDIYRCGFAFGTFYQKLENYDEANEVLSTALVASKKLHNKTLTCEVLLAKSISLIYLKKFSKAKTCLKSAYKLHSTNIKDVEKITKALKVCLGILNYEKKLKVCKTLSERKLILEKIADGLSSINYYTLAIVKYHSALNCMKEDNSPNSDKAPIYYSLAQTYLDNGSFSEALEYFKEEYDCNEGKTLEQVKTLWKMAEILQSEKRIEESKKHYLKAVSLSEQAGDQRFTYNSLNKLLTFYNSINNIDFADDIKKKIDSINYQYESEGESDEENQEPFSDINLDEVSDSDDDEKVITTIKRSKKIDTKVNEKVITTRKRSKKIETKVNEKGETPLHQACIEGNFSKVKRLVKNGHSVNVRDFAGWTPLHEACNYGFYEIVEFLLENEADVNDPGGPECKGITALHDAASCGNLDVIQLLVSKGACVIVHDKNGETPLDALLQWRNRTCDLDDVTLKQCKAVEDELKTKMTEAGISFNDIFSNNPNMLDSCDEQSGSVQMGDKHNRSPSLSSDDDSCDYEINCTPPYLNVNNKRNWDEADDTKAEYKCVMENLRWKTADIVPVKSQPPKINNVSPLVNEYEIEEGLIIDTDKIPKMKKKKRKLNARTSKCIDKYLIEQDSPEKGKTSLFLGEDNNISITSVKSNLLAGSNSVQQSLSLKSENSKFCLRVNIAGKLILVLVPEDTCTISWLMEEAAQHYQSFNGSKPYLTLKKNGAVVPGIYFIKDIFTNNEEVLSSVLKWDEPSLEERYLQLCKNHNVTVSSSIKKRLQCFQAASEINFSNCNIPYLHLNIIFRTFSNYKILQHLNFSGTPLTYSVIKKLVSCLPNYSDLYVLNLSCCSLTSQSIKEVLDFVDGQISKNTILPSLKVLDLSYNIFSPCPNLVAFFKLHSLASVNLSSCGLDSTFFSKMLLETVKDKENLEELNISGNIFEGEEISNFLLHLPKKCLKKLNLSNTVKKEVGLGFMLHSYIDKMLPYLCELKLQGCFINDDDLEQIAASFSYITNLKVVDLSTNPSLSNNGIYKFIDKAYESKLNISDLNITGTCVWNNSFYNPIQFLKLNTLKHLCFDNCIDDLIEKIMQLWIEKWGSRAICTNILFCELIAK